MAAASLTGIFFQEAVYPTVDLRRSFVANDVVNLVIGLPILLGAMGLASRGRLVGLLLWPGALLYALYNYMIFLLAMPFNVIYFGVVVLYALGVYAVVRLFTAVDQEAVRMQLRGAVYERLGGGVLVLLSGLFLMMAAGEMAQIVSGKVPLVRTDVALHITDIVFALAWIAGGVLLWRRRALGYAAGLGLLFQFSMLFVGLLVLMIIQPYITGESFPAGDFIFISVMGMICAVPGVLFGRGVLARDHPDS
jgi:hypothetical protein